jgi:hypothetical protein
METQGWQDDPVVLRHHGIGGRGYDVMTGMIELVMPFLLTGIAFGGYWLGNKVRDYAHVMIPFKDPCSLSIFALMLLPFWIDLLAPEYAIFFHCDNIWYLSSLLAALTGYVIGYCLNSINMVYVGVHHILDRTQDIYPIVYYYGPDGKMYYQSQKFRDIVKTMIFKVRYPLNFPINQIVRTRHVMMCKIFMRLDAKTVDLAGHEVTISEKKVGFIKFKVESHKYTPSPNCTDAPYDWIIRAVEYEDIFTEFTEMQVQAMESKAELKVASVKGGAMVLGALAKKSPSNMFMDELGIDLEETLSRKAQLRKEMNSPPPFEEGKKDKKRDKKEAESNGNAA